MGYQGKVYIIYDGQAGSCGKGKFVGQFAMDRNKNIAVSMNNNTPNAGHTFVFDNGEKIVTTHIPIAFVSQNVKNLAIGAGALINPDTLEGEISRYSHLLGERKLYVHKRAGIILPKHIEEEKATIKSGSTFKGTGSALAEKILRKPGIVLAKDVDWSKRIELIDDEFMQSILTGKNGFTGSENILIETSQGFDLDINHGLEYPYVTSRQCTPAQALADSGIPHNINTETYMIIRPYPIRINNESAAGNFYTGDYSGSKEITWDIIEQRSGCTGIKEKEQTTVTKKLRRVFEFNDSRFQRAVALTNPDFIILNFAQYLDCNIGAKVDRFIEKVESISKKKVAYVGTGAKNCEYRERI